MTEASGRKRKAEPKTFVTCPIVFGSSAVHLGKKSDETATHRWKLYVRGPRNEDLSSFILKVAFILHPSFPEPVREVKHPPFEVSETGWGEFEAGIRLYFKDPNESPLDLFHLIKLYPQGPPQPASTMKKAVPVVAEQYDEVVFCEPSDKFRRQLMAYVGKDDGQELQDPLGSGYAGTVFDDSLDIERLVAVQQHLTGEIEVAKARLLQLHASIVEVTHQQQKVGQSKLTQGTAAIGVGTAGEGSSGALTVAVGAVASATAIKGRAGAPGLPGLQSAVKQTLAKGASDVSATAKKRPASNKKAVGQQGPGPAQAEAVSSAPGAAGGSPLPP